MRIDIHVPVSEQSKPYYQHLVRQYTETCTSADELRFFPHVINGVGSGGHANSIEEIFASADPDTDVTIIADSDTVMLHNEWNTTLCELLMSTDVVGTTYEPIGGFSSGPGPVQTYKGRPNATWLAVSGKCVKCFAGQSMQPAKQNHLSIADDELAKRYNLPAGNQLLRDVGWQIPEIIDRNGLKDIGLVHVKPTKGAKAILTGNDYHEEYQLPDGTPFVAHQRGSMKHPFRGNPTSSAFYNAVDAYFNGR